MKKWILVGNFSWFGPTNQRSVTDVTPELRT
jgi:hypothetical protein